MAVSYKQSRGRLSSENIVQRAQSNFAPAFYFLPGQKRKAAEAFYAFCRTLDDGVDSAAGEEEALRNVGFWKEEIDKIRRGEVDNLTPLGREVEWAVRSFDLSLKNFELLMEGVETDIRKKRFETFDDLYRYCYRVASSVGFVCCEICGVRSGSAVRYAEFTGIGVQLTNILRDLREDAEMGRIYLPLEDLGRFCVTEEEVLTADLRGNLIALLDFEAQRAEAFFRMGQGILSPKEALKLYFCHLLAGTYRAILEELRRENFGLRGGKGKVNAPAGRKVTSVVKTMLGSVLA